jgi:phospholipase C
MASRRDFLKQSLLLSTASAIPESIQRAFAISPTPGTTYLDAEHVVILMQENRSFDHAFGMLQGVRGYNDPRAMRLPNGHSVFLQTNAAGETYAPWRLDIKDTKATWTGSLPHSRESQVDAWNNGHHDGWLDAKRAHKEYAPIPFTMGHYTRQDLPFYYALADAFTICDHNYCSASTSTTPNRLYFWSGTIRDPRTNAACIRNSEADFGTLNWTTFPERLQQAGIPWKVYQNDVSAAGGKTPEEDSWLANFTDNPLEFFAQYNVHLNPKYSLALEEELAKLHAHPDPKDAARIAHLQSEMDRAKAKFSQLPVAAQDLYRRAFASNPENQHVETIAYSEGGVTEKITVPSGDVLKNFRDDVRSGKLPPISWLVAPENFSDHPSAPWYGAWYVSEVMDILTKNPEVWRKTIFILTYDENDGYFDHAPSYVAGVDTADEYIHAADEVALGVDPAQARSGPIGLGFRVPMIVASPWSRGGFVNSQLFDHTSTLQMLENFVQHKFNKTVRETNISAWRRTICGNLASVFRPYDSAVTALPFVARDPFVASIQRAKLKPTPAGYRSLSAAEIAHPATHLPKQEPGIRPACALPYDFDVEASSPDRSHITLTLRVAAASAGVPFNVYLYNTHDGMIATTHAVQQGTTLTHSVPLSVFPNGVYDIVVHAPNGFYRAFRGTPLSASLSSSSRAAHGALELHLQGSEIKITDNAYGSRPVTLKEATNPVTLDVSKQHGWYDVTVQSGDTVHILAGHIETGQASFTDPQMGRAV